MENTMGTALKALKEQVAAGFAAKSDSIPSHAAIDHPTRIGDLLQQAEAARDDLRHSGYCR